MRTLADVQFFYDNAGWSYDPSSETSEQGRTRWAIQLMEAEDHAFREGYRYEWANDWEGDHSYTKQSEFEGYEVATCETCTLYDEDGNVLASLGCIDDATDDYRRVVQAELAYEAMDKERVS